MNDLNFHLFLTCWRLRDTCAI